MSTTGMMYLPYRWEQMRNDVTASPFTAPGFAAYERFAGWIVGYADFCEENGDPASAEDFRWLGYVAIQLCAIIREDACKADNQRLIDAGRKHES